MKVRETYVRMEIAFWTFAIPLLQESKFLHRLIQRAYPLVVQLRRLPAPPRPLIWTGAGLSLGFLIGFLGAALFA